MEKIVVTGGSGYIGSHIVSVFAQAGHDVYSLDRVPRSWSGHQSINSYVVNLQNYDDTLRILKKIGRVDCIIHCAGELGINRSYAQKDLFYDQNVFVTDCILRAAVALNIRKLFFASSASVYADVYRPVTVDDLLSNDPSPYSFTKIICEERIKQVARYTDMSFVIFRYFNVVGCDPDDIQAHDHYLDKPNLFPLLAKSCMNDRPLSINGGSYHTKDGTCVRDYINVCDLARLHLSAYEMMSSERWERKLAGIYNAGSGKGYSVKEIIGLCEEVSNKRIVTFESERRLGDSPFLCADIEKTVQTFDWTPEIPVRETFMRLFKVMTEPRQMEDETSFVNGNWRKRG